MQEGLPLLSRTLFKQTPCLFLCLDRSQGDLLTKDCPWTFTLCSAGSVMSAAGLFIVATGPVLIVLYVFFNLAAGLFVFNAALVFISAGTLPQGVLIVYLCTHEF